MYQRHKLLRRLTLLFILLSASLWASKVLLENHRRCQTDRISSEIQKFGPHLESLAAATKGAVHWPHSAAVQNITSWLEHNVKVAGQNTLESSCNATGYMLDHDQHQHATRSSQRTDNYVATLTAVGELHLGLDSVSRLEHNAAELLTGAIAEYIQDSDETFTSIDVSAASTDKDIELLSSLHALGVSQISLANGPMSRLAVEDKVRQTVRALEAADMKWFGLNAKKHHIIVTANRQRIGCLAFCAVHNMCTESSQLPFGPVKYTSKLATTTVNELKSHGVSVIIVMVYWGRETSLFSDEMALPVARHLASLGVDVIIGYHPNGIQGHAYMGKTLVLFSLGHVLSYDHIVPYCWNKAHKKWRYSSAKECLEVQPAARDGLLQREMHSRIYKLYISKSEPVTAEYVTLPLVYEQNRIRRPIESGHRQNWTLVCGERDTHCLSCEHF